ncbi:MAG: PAS domain S-box protein [Candidatus Hermodarchaeota archaeon]
MEINFNNLDEPLRSFFEYSLDLLFILDSNTKIINVNSMALKRLKYTREEFLNKTLDNFLLHEDVKDFKDFFNRIKRKERPKEKIIIRLKNKNNNYLDLEFNGVPLQKKNEEYQILGIAHDITEYKEAKQNLIESEYALREQIKELSCLYDLSRLIESLKHFSFQK